MAHTTSTLQTKVTTEAQNNEGIPWSTQEAAVELVLTAISGVTLGASDAAAVPGADATKAIAVQGVTGGKSVDVTPRLRQLTGVPSSFALRNADGTVFTLAAGEIGFIQNLSADAPLAIKLGAAATSSSLNFILPVASGAASGSSVPFKIDFWTGVVSVAKMAGTASYLAWSIAP